ncbi:molybdate ABC transporter substrate-binding protein [Corynebacterium spheniscorum]|uniref:Molybdate transport system substrate-binding protein n=1 Tax=Corynebacterium spheniscorum TaxID=185761 RepID=A0A1I2SJN1_9CORY|nr:molybdate ABC transporter substrate-binding protein [Corynebacterium spheniscorum]KAA8724030.1 molybdate ABC transporter substrate-binding protein [Corynebacterium spheniscorum]SFG52892.1 molybdate transport system substrate-binding protein [Corynebacterium spheniscorum]
MNAKRFTVLLGCAALSFGMIACSPSTSTTDSTAASDAAASKDQSEAVELTVLGAASTRVLNDELSAQAAKLDQPLELQYVNAGSSTLVQQLADGSPGDLLITADQRNMDRAVEQGSVKEPVVVATNSLVMVVPKGNPAGIKGLDESLDNAKLVLCDEQVPCGTVSKKLQDKNGVQLKPVSLEHSVSDVLGKVVSGEADAGWVYRTDAAAAGDKVEVIDIPGAEEEPNSLVAAVTANTPHPDEAEALLKLLRSDSMRTEWEKRGFTPAN